VNPYTLHRHPGTPADFYREIDNHIWFLTDELKRLKKLKQAGPGPDDLSFSYRLPTIQEQLDLVDQVLKGH